MAGSLHVTDVEGVVGVPLPAAGRVLVVDDIAANAELIRAVLIRDGFEVVRAASGEEALDLVSRDLPDLILLDVMMPGLDGFETCRRLKANPATRLLPVVLITALKGTDDKVRGLDAGADDFVVKPFNPHELRARVRSLVRIKRYTDDLDSAESVIRSLALTIEARDRSTDGHCQRLAAYATALGARLGLGEDDLAALERGGFLHDIGKIAVPDAVLSKPGRLTPEEYTLIQAHTVVGDRLCGTLRLLRGVRPIVRSHHERFDGSGYPDGLRGDAIPFLAQIMAIVDVFDALTTARPYKPAHSAGFAFEELRREAAAGRHRPDLVDAFVELGRAGRLPQFAPGPPEEGRALP